MGEILKKFPFLRGLVFTALSLVFAIMIIAFTLPLPYMMTQKWQWLLVPQSYFLIIGWPFFTQDLSFLSLLFVPFLLFVAGIWKGILFSNFSQTSKIYLVIFLWVCLGAVTTWIGIVASI